MPSGHRLGLIEGAGRGVVAAALALALTEVVAWAGPTGRPSLVDSVATRLITWWSGPLKDVAIRLFGVHDKTALLVRVVVVALLAGMVLGMISAHVVWAGPGGLVIFAAFGIASARADPLASAGWASLAAVVAVAAGTVVLVAAGPMPRAGRSAVAAVAAADHVEPTAADLNVDPSGAVGVDAAAPTASERAPSAAAASTIDRRRLALTAAGLGVAAVAGFGTRQLRLRLGPTGGSGVLPKAARMTVVPSQPFAIDGLTPYLTPNERFYRIDTAVTVPRVDVADWSLRVSGRVDRPRTYRYADLARMDLVEEPVTIACVSNDVGGGLVGNATWRGVPLAALLGPAGVHPDATQLIGRSVDGFTVGFSPALALDGRPSMVALGMNGVPLPPEHGYPARLIVPGLYGYASATKWLTELELTRWEDAQSYWVERGWARDGLMQVQSRVDLAGPDPDEPGTIVIAGVAWARPFGVAKVEVQLDRGRWLPAELGNVASPSTWVQWRYRWRGATPGDHLVTARVTDGAGRAQVEEPRRAEPDGATGYDYRGFSVG